MTIRFRHFLILIAVISLSLFFSAFAQEPEKNEECQTLQECEELLKEYESKIAQYEKEISEKSKKSKTLKNQIAILKKEIEKLELQIRQSNAIIKELKIEITDTEKSIDKTTSEIENYKKNLATILRTIYKEDQKSDLEILFTGDTLSDFFNHLTALESLNLKNQEILGNIETAKTLLENQKTLLAEDKDDLERMVKIQILQKKENEDTKKENDEFLKLTEAQYQQYLKEKKELEKRTAEIMARIAQLTLPGLDVPRDRKELYELANWAGNITGVRPALILGLIEGESALGTNVGQCNCAGQTHCRHPNISYKQVMSSKQWDSFEKIVKELGLNINTTPASCAVNGGMVQMGGAMGPAQFMPNTWLKLGYKQKVENITGVRPANPWRARDAFLAAALYLADWGANSQKYNDEKGAVTAYLCGTNIMTSRCRSAGGSWYTNDYIMPKVEKWQEWINQGF